MAYFNRQNFFFGRDVVKKSGAIGASGGSGPT